MYKKNLFTRHFFLGLVFQLVHQGLHLDIAGVQQEPDQCGRVQHLSAVAEKTRKREAHEVGAGSIICANFVLDISVGNVKEQNLTFVTFSRTGTRCLLTTPEGATRPQQVLKRHFIEKYRSYCDILPIENLIG